MNRKCFFPDVLKIATTSKEWRDGGDSFAITNNQHTLNRYSKVYVIEDNTCKMSVCESPWVMSYHPLYLSTYWPKDRSKPPSFHGKNIQKAPPLPQKLLISSVQERRRVRLQRRSGVSHSGRERM